jgi:hypothetical protein
VYVSVNNGVYQYVGRTGNGTDNVYEWRQNHGIQHAQAKAGPQFGNTYRFAVYCLTRQQTTTGKPVLVGPFFTAYPVSLTAEE